MLFDLVKKDDVPNPRISIMCQKLDINLHSSTNRMSTVLSADGSITNFQNPVDLVPSNASSPSTEEYDPFLDELLADEDAVREANGALLATDAEDLLNLEPHEALDLSLGEAHEPTSSDPQRPIGDARQVLSICLNILKGDQGRASDETMYLRVTRILAQLSRNELWAVALAEQGLLAIYLDALQDNPGDTNQWVDHAIRIIANCCTRSRRTKMSTFPRAPISKLVGRLARKETAAMSAKAICAITSGVESLMEELEKSSRLTSHLLDGIENGYYDDDDADVLLELLEDLTPLLDSQLLDDNQLTIITEIPLRFVISDEGLAVVGNLLLHALPTNTSFNSSVSVQLRCLLRFFARTYSEVEYEALIDGSSSDVKTATENGASQQKALVQLRTNLISKCGKLATHVDDIQVVKSDVSLLVKWLTFSVSQVQIFGCLFLGNLVYHHPKHGETLVQCFDLSDSLRLCMDDGNDHGVLNSAFDLLQNMATLACREYLGKAGLLESLSRFWRSLNQFSGKALYHTRQLLHDCPENALQFLGSDVFAAETEPGDVLLLNILDAYDQMDDATIRAEIGKVLAEIWRTLEPGSKLGSNKPPSKARSSPEDTFREMISSEPHFAGNAVIELQADSQMLAGGASNQHWTEDDAKVTNILDSHSFGERLGLIFSGQQSTRVVRPILGLIKSGNETLISQGWFTFSLMAQRLEGATAIYECCIENKENLAILNETLSTQEKHPALRGNAQYLVATLQRQFVSSVVLPRFESTDVD